MFEKIAGLVVMPWGNFQQMIWTVCMGRELEKKKEKSRGWSL